ncbi:hypothetical protein EPUS_07758 [Endocarpon pusillum Z07020]|uniref:Uncharacterized protein n=1 Tax=Endocarpon pusillum (strain Z07020 / HMAS-L-300199) TaxID=1263415 RepID=U1GH20_ENDPU|nr:uncharacterized protein EPUS_07758 [Endocarpon pusillum Z07020]ERF71086.1 hypothetical protein EPUS_07758 [Endocarpon pusillum Z07020]
MAGILERSRLPAHNGLLHLQRVKLTSKNRISTFMLLTSALALGSCIPLPERILPAEVRKMVQEHKKLHDREYGESWHKEHRRLEELNRRSKEATSGVDSMERADRPQGGIFVPMTWLRKCEKEYYSGDDPEWQEFVKLSKDLKRVKAVKSGLTASVCSDLNNRAVITRLLGRPLTVYATWLDFDFPSTAPVEYERSGILWTNDKVTWVSRRVNERRAKRLYSVLFPTALLSSLQALSSTLLTSYFSTSRSLWSKAGKSDQQEPIAKPVEGSSQPTVGSNGSKSASMLSTQTRTSTHQNLSLAATPRVQAELIRNIMPEAEPNSAISAAARDFKLNFLRKWRSTQLDIPRGACYLRGEIGIKGPKGRCKMSVYAVYLPKENAFVHVLASTTGIWLNTQRPLGKPKSEKPQLENGPKG